MVIIPPQGSPTSFGAEKLTELGDIDFQSIVNPKEGDTRVLAYKPGERYPFSWVNITSLFALKKKSGSNQSHSVAKGFSALVSSTPAISTPTSVTS